MKKIYYSFSAKVITLALLIGCALPWLQLEAETILTGPSKATGPNRAVSTSLGPRKKSPTAKVRFDASGLTDEEFVARVLAAMTLEEKIGQMCQIYPEGEVLAEKDAQAILSGEVGSIFYTGDEDQVREAQRVAVEDSRLGIPLIVGRDVIHGLRTVFPIPIGQASSWNPELVKRAAEVAASESRRVGIHWTFAPMVDISRDPRWGRIAESCGEDPVLASALGVAMVEGFQSADTAGKINGIAACAKHYVAYGLAEGGRDYNRAMVSRSELHNVFLRPFKGCVEAGAASLMTAFNTVNGIPATGHQDLLRRVLKQQWEFPGFVVSDWGSITEMIAHGYATDEKQAADRALHAGVDMEMVSTCYRDELKDLLAANVVQTEMIDEAVRRILHAKLRLNLFTAPYADHDEPELFSASHQQVARELAQQSIVMLKNDGVLPLQRSKLKNVAVIGPLADAGTDQLGCWVLDAKPSETITPLAALKTALGDNVTITHVPCTQSKYDKSLDDFDEAVAAAKAADVVLLFVGEEEALSGEAHCRTDLSLPGSQSRLVQLLSELDVPLVMTVLAGRPMTISEEVAAADALLYAWHPGTMGGAAVADLLLGEFSPSGKLPVTFPKSVGQVPLYYNHCRTGRPSTEDYQPPALAGVKSLDSDLRYRSHYVDSDPFPLFHFGFGLSYTEFEYQDIELSTDSIESGQVLAVRVQVANTGSRTGVETVQLYTRDLVGSEVRPVKELADFRRVEIQPGEVVVVEFALPYKTLGFFNGQEEYLVEAGEFEVAVGGSSTTTLSEKFSVK